MSAVFQTSGDLDHHPGIAWLPAANLLLWSHRNADDTVIRHIPCRVRNLAWPTWTCLVESDSVPQAQTFRAALRLLVQDRQTDRQTDGQTDRQTENTFKARHAVTHVPNRTKKGPGACKPTVSSRARRVLVFTLRGRTPPLRHGWLLFAEGMGSRRDCHNQCGMEVE